jgi:hypothetical protein
MDNIYGNTKQEIFAYGITFNQGKEKGKDCYLVNVGKLQVLFNLDNALDIAWVRYAGVNISYLSKNGLNNNVGAFGNKFEGGFLYTCGLDNVSACVPNKEIHGSLHYNKASDCSYQVFDDKVEVSGTVYLTALFGINIQLQRKYTVYCDKIVINDTIENNAFNDDKFVLLYHVNFGYPFVQEGLKLDMPITKSEGLTDFANKNLDAQLQITKPIESEEMVFYNYLTKGEVNLVNEQLDIACKMTFDTEKFPVLLQWKSMVKGDYVLGIEPSTTRFDNCKFTTLKPNEQKNYIINIDFKLSK